MLILATLFSLERTSYLRHFFVLGCAFEVHCACPLCSRNLGLIRHEMKIHLKILVVRNSLDYDLLSVLKAILKHFLLGFEVLIFRFYLHPLLLELDIKLCFLGLDFLKILCLKCLVILHFRLCDQPFLHHLFDLKKYSDNFYFY